MDIASWFLDGFDILKSTVDSTTKAVLYQIGDVLGQTSEGDNAESWQEIGFVSRPSIPVPGKQAAQAVGFRGRRRHIIVATRDLRGLALAGALADGETCVYAGGTTGDGQARMLLKADGSVILYTRKGNTSGGVGMTISLDGAGGGINIVDSHGYGMVTSSAGVSITAGNASLVLGSDGIIKLVGIGLTQIDGAVIVLGSAGAPPINSAIRGPTGIVGLASAKVLIE